MFFDEPTPVIVIPDSREDVSTRSKEQDEASVPGDSSRRGGGGADVDDAALCSRSAAAAAPLSVAPPSSAAAGSAAWPLPFEYIRETPMPPEAIDAQGGCECT